MWKIIYFLPSPTNLQRTHMSCLSAMESSFIEDEVVSPRKQWLLVEHITNLMFRATHDDKPKGHWDPLWLAQSMWGYCTENWSLQIRRVRPWWLWWNEQGWGGVRLVQWWVISTGQQWTSWVGISPASWPDQQGTCATNSRTSTRVTEISCQVSGALVVGRRYTDACMASLWAIHLCRHGHQICQF